MKPCDMVSSFRGANTLFQGQQINGQTQIKREQRYKKETRRRDTQKEERTQRDRDRREKTKKRGRRNADQRRSKGPEQRNQDRSEIQRQRVRVHCKQIVVTTSGVVNKEV
jgi:hypothetical protein